MLYRHCVDADCVSGEILLLEDLAALIPSLLEVCANQVWYSDHEVQAWEGKKIRNDGIFARFSVWLDTEDILSGSDWHGALGTALDNCKAIIPVITQKYISSHFCKEELYMANSNMKLIFPVFFEDADMSASDLTRGVKLVISSFNWTMFRPGVDNYNVSRGKLVQGLLAQGTVHIMDKV